MVDIKGLLSNPMAALQSSRQPGGLLAPVTSFREAVTDPRLFIADALINRTPITTALGNYATINKALTPEDEERKILWLAYHLTDKVENHFRTVMDTGKLASVQINDIKKNST